MTDGRVAAASVVAVAVIAVVAVGGVVATSGTTVALFDNGDGGEEASGAFVPAAETNNSQYDADRVVSDPTPGTASVEMDSLGEGTVVIDTATFATSYQIQPLTQTLAENGHEVRVVSGRESLEETLDGATGFISVGVTQYDESAREALTEFLDEGGHAVFTAEPAAAFDSAEQSELFSTLAVAPQPGYVYNLEENDLNYQRVYGTPDGEVMLTEGVDRVVFDTATTLGAETATETIGPIAGSQRSVTRAETTAPIAVREDNLAMIGDVDFFSPTNVKRADNDALVGNLADFLVEGETVEPSAGDQAPGS